jgi:hypothetical protein
MFRRLLRQLQGECYRKLKILPHCLIEDPVVLYKHTHTHTHIYTYVYILYINLQIHIYYTCI